MLSAAWTDFQGLWGVCKAVLKTKISIYSLLSCLYCCTKNTKYLYENSGRLVTERILRTFGESFEGRI